MRRCLRAEGWFVQGRSEWMRAGLRVGEVVKDC